jgi:hypothetical protein
VNIANDHFGVAVAVANVVVTYYVVLFHRKHSRGGIVPFFAYE